MFLFTQTQLCYPTEIKGTRQYFQPQLPTDNISSSKCLRPESENIEEQNQRTAENEDKTPVRINWKVHRASPEADLTSNSKAFPVNNRRA